VPALEEGGAAALASPRPLGRRLAIQMGFESETLQCAAPHAGHRSFNGRCRSGGAKLRGFERCMHRRREFHARSGRLAKMQLELEASVESSLESALGRSRACRRIGESAFCRPLNCPAAGPLPGPWPRKLRRPPPRRSRSLPVRPSGCAQWPRLSRCPRMNAGPCHMPVVS
jgi:hypothetical protein